MKPKSMFLALAFIAAVASTGCDKERTPSDAGALVPKTVDQDRSLPSISVNNTMLHSEAFGNPNHPMVIYLHGGPGGDYRNGLKMKELTADGFYVVFYDQRGSGLSKRHEHNSYSLQLLFDDLTAVIQHYRTSPSQKVFLFGHSWGAILAAGYINQYPNRIQGAILAEPGGFTWESIKEYGKKSRKLEWFSEATNDALYGDQFFTGRKNDHEILDYKLAVTSAYTYAKGNPEGIEGSSPFWRNGAVVWNSLMELGEKQGFDVTANLHQYNTKVLFLYSERNTALGLEAVQKEAACFPKSEIRKITDTGHELIHFKWDQVYPIAVNYLNALK